MRHPTEGVLRRLLDEPAGVSDPDREHVAGCPQCLGELAAMRAGRRPRRRGAGRPRRCADVDVAAAWRRLSHGQRPVPAPRRSGGARARRRAPAGRALAAPPCRRRSSRSPSSWPAPAPLPPTTGCRSSGPSRSPRSASAPPTCVALPDLSAYGERRGDRRRRPARGRRRGGRGGGDRARRARGDRPCPRGVSGEPVYQVGARGERHLHLLGRAGRPGRRRGRGDAAGRPAGPGRQPGAAGRRPGRGRRSGRSRRPVCPPSLVGRAVAPTAFSSGVPFETVRDYLLSLPGLPDDVAAQLRTFTADGSTLPLPVPADQVTTSSAEVNGVPATVLADPRPDAGRRRLGGRRRGDRRGRLAGRRRGPVGRPGAALTWPPTPPPPTTPPAARPAARAGRRPAAGARRLVLGPAQAVRPAAGGRRRVPRGGPRPGGRAARPERGRQDHGDQDAPRPGPARTRER